MFTKLHKEERDLLFKTNSVVAYEVYMHLKDKYSYFKAECYDLTRCISDYLDVPERTIKDAIKRLKTVGLISTTKKGKVNIYSFPILNKIEGKETKEDMTNTVDLSPSNDEDIPTPQPIEEKPTEAIKTTIEEEVQINNNIDNDMGTFIGYIETPTQEVEFDNFSDTLNDLLDEYEGVIEQLTSMIAKANISGDVSIIADAKMAEMRIKNIAKELINEIDKTNYTNYINEKIEIKTKRLQVA
jgi:hypothetical protein